jgi:methoxymalonate biosynthesis acyl carrier protein
MTDENISSPIRDFIARAFEGRVVGDDEDIFALGFGNSLFAMQLVAFVEKEFGIEIDSEDLDIANFRTIRAISSLVTAKLTTAAQV